MSTLRNRWVGALIARARDRSCHRHLAHLDDRMLRDIGLTRADVLQARLTGGRIHHTGRH